MPHYPKTKKDSVIDGIHGDEVIDNYRWLEDGKNKEVQHWIQDQNNFTDANLSSNLVTTFSSELEEEFRNEIFSNYYPSNGKYFWTERKPEDDQPILYMKQGLEGNPQKIIDTNILMKQRGKTVSLDYWHPSPSGQYLAYGLSEGGTEIATMYILNLSTMENLEDEIPRARYSQVAWLPDESAFYYKRLPQIGEVPPSEENYHAKLYKHELGRSFKSDQMIFGEGRSKNDMYGFIISKNGKYLLVRVAQNWNTSEVFLVDTSTNRATEIVSNIDAVFTPYFAGNDIVLYTNYKAPFLRVIKASPENLPESLDEWKEIIPESQYKLDSVKITENSLIATYLVDVINKIHVYDFEGSKIQGLDIPPMSTTSCSLNSNESEVFVSISNFFSQKTMLYLENREANLKELRKAPAHIDDNDYVVKQEWVKSKDGVKVPIFIIHKKDLVLNGKNPTILNGYGCHGIVKNPYYLGGYKPWLQRGGIFALANIRGGGEFGEEWHRAGSLSKKQNTFDDFIACSEYLIEHKYTSSKQLGIVGGSNGGLMVGAVMTQRPDLYKAVVCKVPVLDLYRFHLFLIAERWVHEFGDPRKKEEFEWLKKWSPYHQIKEDTTYPNVFFTTSVNDKRVDPLHARKMTALMQSNNLESKVLLRTYFDVGHGPGRTVKQRVKDSAETLGFFAIELGLDI